VSRDGGRTFQRPDLGRNGSKLDQCRMPNVFFDDSAFISNDVREMSEPRRCHNFSPMFDENPAVSEHNYVSVAGYRERNQPWVRFYYSCDGLRWRRGGVVPGKSLSDTLASLAWDPSSGRYSLLTRENGCRRARITISEPPQSAAQANWSNNTLRGDGSVADTEWISGSCGQEELYSAALSYQDEGPALGTIIGLRTTVPISRNPGPRLDRDKWIMDARERFAIYTTRDSGKTWHRQDADFMPLPSIAGLVAEKPSRLDEPAINKNWRPGIYHRALGANGVVHDRKAGLLALYVAVNVAYNALEKPAQVALGVARLITRWGGVFSLRAGKHCGIASTRPIRACGPALYLNMRPRVPSGSVRVFVGGQWSDRLSSDHTAVRVSLDFKEGAFVELKFEICNADLFGFQFGLSSPKAS
jgi:hypothetical protein